MAPQMQSLNTQVLSTLAALRIPKGFEHIALKGFVGLTGLNPNTSVPTYPHLAQYRRG